MRRAFPCGLAVAGLPARFAACGAHVPPGCRGVAGVRVGKDSLEIVGRDGAVVSLPFEAGWI
jgi:hypothetical protein